MKGKPFLLGVASVGLSISCHTTRHSMSYVNTFFLATSTVFGSSICCSQDSPSTQVFRKSGCGSDRAGLTGSTRLAGAPRICLSPHFSRKLVFGPQHSGSTTLLTPNDNLYPVKVRQSVCLEPIIAITARQTPQTRLRACASRETARQKESSLTFVPLQ